MSLLTYVMLPLVLLVCAARVFAISLPGVALVWDASTDPTVTGYNVYYGTSSRTYTNLIRAGNATSVLVSNLLSGTTYYFAATTYNAAGFESEYSIEAAYSVPSSGNTPPTLDTLTNLTINQDAGEQVVLLTGITSGSTNEIQTLSVNAFSSNPGLIANPVVTYTSPDTNGSLSFSSAAGSFGSAIITVMVDDGAAISNTIIRSFTVTVNPVVNPPSIDLVSDVTIAENSGLQNLILTGITSGSTNTNSALVVTAISSNPALIANPGINYTSPASTGTLSFIPAANASGSAKITVTVTDDQPTNNSTSVSFGVTVTQSAPTPGLLTNAMISPNTTFRLLITPPATNGDRFNISLASGAPAGAKITSRRGVTWLVWTPTTAQASTTNLIGIRITDNTNPALSTNETALVIVEDFLALVVGSTSIQSGQNGTVPLALSSSDGVANLSFSIAWPSNSLPNPTLSISAAGVASSSMVTQPNGALIKVQMSPNQVLQGSNIIGQLHFQSLASQPSGYLNLPVNNLTAIKPTSVSYINSTPFAGQVAVINNVAILQAATSATQTRNLTILGKVGSTYQIQYCTNFGPSSVWYPLLSYSQTNTSQSFTVDPSLPQVSYRVQQK